MRSARISVFCKPSPWLKITSFRSIVTVLKKGTKLPACKALSCAWEKTQRGCQPRPQGLLAFQDGGGSGEDPGTQQITCLQREWRCIQNGGYGEKGEKNWVRDPKVKINKMAEKAEVQFKKK